VLTMMALVACVMIFIVALHVEYTSLQHAIEYSKGIRAALLVVFTTLACGLLGFIDDAAKVTKERSLGLTARAKLIGQITVGIVFSLAAVNWVDVSPDIVIPLTTAHIPLGIGAATLPWFGEATLFVPWLYILFTTFMLVAMSNAVNLTDGLDGLAAGTVTIVALVFAAIG